MARFRCSVFSLLSSPCCCELSAALDSWWPQQNLCNKHHIHKLSLKAGKLLFQKKSHQSKSFLRSASDQGGAQEGPFAVTTGPVLTHVVADGFSSDYSFFCASLTDQFKLGQSLLHLSRPDPGFHLLHVESYMELIQTEVLTKFLIFEYTKLPLASENPAVLSKLRPPSMTVFSDGFLMTCCHELM